MSVFATSVPCQLSSLASLRSQLRAWLDATALPDEVKRSVVLATHEAAANAIEHAAPCEEVDIRAAIDEDAIVIEVKDDGRWRLPSFDDDERGRGLEIIRGLVAQVEIKAEPDGTTVRILQPLPPPATAPGR